MNRAERRDIRRRELAERYAGLPAQLDGRPAVISGRLRRFATVAHAPGGEAVVEFSWEAVGVVMERLGGRFLSGDAGAVQQVLQERGRE